MGKKTDGIRTRLGWNPEKMGILLRAFVLLMRTPGIGCSSAASASKLQRVDQGGEGAGWERDCASAEKKGQLSLQCLTLFLYYQNSNDQVLTQMRLGKNLTETFQRKRCIFGCSLEPVNSLVSVYVIDGI